MIITINQIIKDLQNNPLTWKIVNNYILNKTFDDIDVDIIGYNGEIKYPNIRVNLNHEDLILGEWEKSQIEYSINKYVFNQDNYKYSNNYMNYFCD